MNDTECELQIIQDDDKKFKGTGAVSRENIPTKASSDSIDEENYNSSGSGITMEYGK